jgi:cell fate regulator YaaT (PSP1 superfamily)
MNKIVGIKFRGGGKVYYFDAGELDPAPAQCVIVETERGLSVGTVAVVGRSGQDVPSDPPLKPILRVASEEDQKKIEQNRNKEVEAKAFCQTCIERHGLDMRLVEVEHLFDGSKIIFYFTADERVDFRGLVRDLAAKFRTRIEMRQIGVRNKARLVGGIGSCGRELCCCSFLTNFEPVSVKMAKDQNVSLNPAKISGVCGRLMCCFKYEYDTYVDLKKDMPKIGKTIVTKEGTGRVIRQNVLANKITIQLEDGSEAEVSLSSIEENADQ